MSIATRPAAARAVLGVVGAPLRWLERARGRRRLALVLLYALVAAVAAVFVARERALRNLPDVGDPFDVAAFGAPRPGDAFPLYRQAAAAYRSPSEPTVGNPFPYGMGQPTPAGRRWIDDNAKALELWRRATERPDVGYHDPPREDPAFSSQVEAPFPLGREYAMFAWMAGVRARDCAEAGDPAGAWAWHRARLRGSRHVAMRAGSAGRMAALFLHREACAAAGSWAQDPRVDAPLLRRALADALEVGAMTPPLSDTLKAEYIESLARLDAPSPQVVRQVFERVLESGDATQWHRHLPVVSHLGWFLRNEPKRSRRLVRQVYANWLARCDEQPRAAFQSGPSSDLFVATPPVAGALAPRDLARWLQSPSLADRLLTYRIGSFDVYFADERTQQGRLVLTLAEQLYERERGAPADSPAELVGPYLKALPEGFDDKVSSAGPAAVRTR
jgi:hypothetical protein